MIWSLRRQARRSRQGGGADDKEGCNDRSGRLQQDRRDQDADQSGARQRADLQDCIRYRHIYPMASMRSHPGRVNLKGIVTNEFALDDIQEAMDESVNNKADIVKAVVKIC